MNARRFGSLLAVSLLVAAFVRADEIKNNFQANLNQQSLDALAKDLGAITGGGTFHQGKALGFPIGFDVGVHASAVGIKNEDVILRDDKSTWGGVFGQVEAGLPAKINLIGRFGKVGDSNVIGGGLRYGIIESDLPGLPSLSIQALYDRLSHDYFDMDHISADAVLSFDLPIVRPYIGAGCDHSKLDLTSAAYAGVPASVSRSLDGSASGYRVEGGVNLSLLPFTYLSLGGGLANGEALYHLGLGLSF